MESKIEFESTVCLGGGQCFPSCKRWFYLLNLWMKLLTVSIQVKATEQQFPVALFITLYRVVRTFESVDEIVNSVTIQATEWFFGIKGRAEYPAVLWGMSTSFTLVLRNCR